MTDNEFRSMVEKGSTARFLETFTVNCAVKWKTK